MSGESGEPDSRWNAKTRRRTETEEGSGRRVDLKRRPRGTHRFAEQGLEVEGARRGSRVTGERRVDNDTGARPDDESGTAAKREKPLNGANPGRGSGMQQARKTEWRSKPSRG